MCQLRAASIKKVRKMAIRQRGNSYQVVYRCPGETTVRTETFHSEDEAMIRDM